MDAFFTFLKKGLIALLFLVFTVSATYIPQSPTSHVEEAHAGAALGNFATEVSQLAGNIARSLNLTQNTINAAANVSDWAKENLGDGIGWYLAKRIVSGMIRSLINWVNSGFQGSPSFITDMKGFLLDIADQEIGTIISELGDLGSFICSPFRLDVQVSVALTYARGRENQTAPSCTLTGISNNIRGFITGLNPGNGLSDWVQITSTPETYTPYGAALSAQESARIRLINAKGEVLTEASWGDGFLSQKVCQSISGFTGSDNCSIVKPGKVVQEALSFNLDSGRQSLVQADEINELVAAFLGQLANQALTGAAGILGLSGGDGFGGYAPGPSYLDDLVDQSNAHLVNQNLSADGGSTIADAINTATLFRSDAQRYRDAFDAFDAITTNPDPDRLQARTAVTQIDSAITSVNGDIAELNRLQTLYNAATSDTERGDIVVQFTNLNTINATRAAQQLGQWSDLAANLSITVN